MQKQGDIYMSIFKSKAPRKALSIFLIICLIMGMQISVYTEGDENTSTEPFYTYFESDPIAAFIADSLPNSTDDSDDTHTDVLDHEDEYVTDTEPTATGDAAKDAVSGSDNGNPSESTETTPEPVPEHDKEIQATPTPTPEPTAKPTAEPKVEATAEPATEASAEPTPAPDTSKSDGKEDNDASQDATPAPSDADKDENSAGAESGETGSKPSGTIEATPTETPEPTAEPAEKTDDKTAKTDEVVKAEVVVKKANLSTLAVSASGTDGTVYWELDEEGVLRFAPADDAEEGKFATVFSETNMPAWYQYCTSVKTIEIQGTIGFNTSAANLFDGMTALTEITGIENLDTSGVTDMSYMFNGCSSLTSLDLSTFITSSVTNMDYMFCSTKALTELNLSGWNTESVETAEYMFCYCALPSLDLSGWDFSSLTDAKNMFYLSTISELNLSGVDMSSLTDAGYMFANASFTSVDLSGADFSSVTNFASAFRSCSSLTTLNAEGWKVSSAEDLSSMFYGCSALTSLDLSGWDVGNVTTTAYMFNNCSSLATLNLGGWDVGNVKNMGYMFANCSALTTLDLTGWNPKSATNMESLFSSCTKLTSLDLSGWDVDNVTDMNYMFYQCRGLTSLNLTGWNTENVTNMLCMFRSCSGLTSLDLSSFNTSKVTNMGYMFSSCSGLTTLNISSFDTSSVTTMGAMFSYCTKLKSLVLTNFNTSNVTDMSAMFSNCTSLSTLDVSSFNTSKVTTMASMFYKLQSMIYLDLANFDTQNVTTMTWMFTDSYYLRGINQSFNTSKVQNMSYMFGGLFYIPTIDVSNWDTSSVTNMYYMFYNCQALTTLDVSKWSNKNVQDMGYMFYNCQALTTLDVSKWNTSKVTSMSYMFYQCKKLNNIDVSAWDVSSVYSMPYMFYYCESLTSLNSGNWNTSRLQNASSMFDYCTALESVDVTNWDTSNMNNTSFMFSRCSALKNLDVSKWNTSKVTNMRAMFQNCRSLTEIDVSNWNVSKVKDTGYMFFNCNGVSELDLSKWSTPALTAMDYMFYHCEGLDLLDLSNWDTTKITNMANAFLWCLPQKMILGSNFSSFASGNYIFNYASNIVLLEDAEGWEISKYIGGYTDLYNYQTNAENRVDENGNPKSNVYTVIYTVVYNPNGGTWADGSTDIKRIDCFPGSVFSVTEDVPTLSGKTFSGWDTYQNDPDSKFALKTTYKVTGYENGNPQLTLYADWGEEKAAVLATGDALSDGSHFASIYVVGSDAPAASFDFVLEALDGAPAPSNSEVTVSFEGGEGSCGIDFGKISYVHAGIYKYKITQSSDTEDGWIKNNGTKNITVKVEMNEETGELYVSSILCAHYYNLYKGGTLTDDMNDKTSATQKNHQQNTEGAETLYKSAEWTNKALGQAEINIAYSNLSELDGSDENSTSALYLFTNCTAHGFTKSIAKQNIQFLLKHYGTVIAICAMKVVPYVESDVTYEQFVFDAEEDADVTDAEIDAYLNTIYWAVDMHLGAEYQLSCFDTCLEYYSVDAVFFSYDGSRGYDQVHDLTTQNIFGMSAEEFAEAEFPEPVLKDYDRTLAKLAEIAKNEQLYLMIAEGTNTSNANVLKDYKTLATSTRTLKNTAYLAMMIVDPVTMSTEEGRAEVRSLINGTSAGIDVNEYGKIHTYSASVFGYASDMESTIKLVTGKRYGIEDIIDPRFEVSGDDIRVEVVDPDADGGFTALVKNVDYTIDLSTDKTSGGTVVRIDFIKWKGYPVNIVFPVELNPIIDFTDGNDDFDLTNIGNVKAFTTNVVFDGETQTEIVEDPVVSLETESPKLYRANIDTDAVLPTTGGSGTVMYYLFGLTMMALAAAWFVRKKETVYEK
jgi:LPXTG-motif cell wall-anchored protein